MGFPLKGFGASLWLGLKCLRIAWLRVKLGILVLSTIVANFILFAGFLSNPEGLTLIPTGIIMLVAYSAVMLHMVKWSARDLALFKALGADRGMLTLAVLTELSILGLLSSALGMAGGLILLFLLQGLKTFTLLTLGLVMLSTFLGALLGALSVWKDSRQPVAEILAHA
ncbi:MAG: hypothetical protein DRO52_02615 [Candidatus Hecatellales archaeon]|nr:MAG: hypothetical protein DRO52_02615 [Candidatus Hecatellales archaeon]RLI34106.1 MAG: hypothetical protein DRO53_04400 [Candidatus Bathyarchaeota archaeon]